MEIDYGTRRLEKQMTNATEMKKAFGEMAKKVSMRLAEMRASPNLAALMQIPAPKCHALAGNKYGEWAVSISPNHRLIFIIANEPVPVNQDESINTFMVTAITVIRTEDYH